MLDKEPAPGAIARPLETNFLHAHFILHGVVFEDTPYEGGCYHGVLKFPTNYPMKPPIIIMRTPSGRFNPDRKICFSMSDFHPELWNPMWSIRHILTGLVSFMNSDEITTGGVSASEAHRIEFAKASLKDCLEKDAVAAELFGNDLEAILKEREKSGNVWPPIRPPPKVEVPKVDETPAKKTRRSAKAVQEEAEPKDSDEITPTSSGSSTKNRKKREKEKRKKVEKKFTINLSEQVPKFLEAVQTRLEQNDVDVSQYFADHVCWRTETMEEYTELVSALRASVDNFSLLIESEIGGRSIATFQMAEGISVGDRMVDVVEIPAPKDGSPYQSGLEHVEFVISLKEDNQASSPVNDNIHESKLNDFMEQYPGIVWNTKAKDKEVNPDVSLQVELDEFGLCSVKFHLWPLAEVIKYEISQT
jgi:ubiquitin-conjugating enzyme E2 J2